MPMNPWRSRLYDMEDRLALRDSFCLSMLIWQELMGDKVPPFFSCQEEYDLAKTAVAKWPEARQGHLTMIETMREQVRIAETQARVDAAKQGRIGRNGG